MFVRIVNSAISPAFISCVPLVSISEMRQVSSSSSSSSPSPTFIVIVSVS
ncbi:MAG: hypothetical protein KAS30_01865 [Candidatus Diapherotrites archaeon]|nr:hypothetical protein [Candidatus Diapherotrites archaeon]